MKPIKTPQVYIVEGSADDELSANRLDRMMQFIRAESVREVAIEELDQIAAEHGGCFGERASPHLIFTKFEGKAPSLRARLDAMKKCKDAGCTVRCQFSPFVPLVGWQEDYRAMLRELFDTVEPDLVAAHMVRCSRPASQTLQQWFGRYSLDPEYAARHLTCGMNSRMTCFWPPLTVHVGRRQELEGRPACTTRLSRYKPTFDLHP